MAAIVPEPVEVLKAFAARMEIPYPILSDEGSAIVARFGIEDTRGQPFVPRSGLPYAGNFLLDPRGTVVARYFEEAVAERRTAGSILLEQGGAGTPGQQAPLDHMTLRTSASNAELAPAERFTLALDLELEPGHHAYAPGVQGGYRPLRLSLDANPLFEALPPRFPPGRDYYYAPLKETVPVFEGHVRVLQEVSVAMRPALDTLAKDGEKDVALTGTLEYQVCSDRVCYPPHTAPLRWTFRLRRWSR